MASGPWSCPPYDAEMTVCHGDYLSLTRLEAGVNVDFMERTLFDMLIIFSTFYLFLFVMFLWRI